MQFIQYRDFFDSVRRLKKKEGRFTTAANKVNALLGEISNGVDDPLKGFKVTRKNESRIPKCVKYDITGFSRLITVQADTACILLFAGSHVDVDGWINRNDDARLKADAKGYVTVTCAAIRDVVTRSKGYVHELAGQRFTHLGQGLYESPAFGFQKEKTRSPRFD